MVSVRLGSAGDDGDHFMISMLTAATVAFAVAIFGTAWAVRLFRAWNIGQFIQEELEGHMHKRGTPTMGGIVIILAVVVGYFVSHLRVQMSPNGIGWSWLDLEEAGLLAIGAIVGMGIVGFIDDYQKISRFRNQGLGIAAKFVGQLAVAGFFAWGAVASGASTAIGFVRPTALELGAGLFAVWVLLMLTGFANAVNFTDGLDGLASGSAALVAAAYMIIAFWIFRHPTVYEVEGGLGLASVASAMLGASLGFLWWNAAPARIIMGDVGSQALGGGLAALALLTNTHLLLAIIGGLYVMETLSVIIQVAGFKWFGGRRVFRMAPIHHHFEMRQWPETTIIIRFWILAAIGVALGLGLFYRDFLATAGVDGLVGGSG